VLRPGAKDGRPGVVEARGVDDHDLRAGGNSPVRDHDGGAALTTEASAHGIPAVCRHGIIDGGAFGEREGRGRHNQDCGEGAPARPLIIAAVAIER